MYCTYMLCNKIKCLGNILFTEVTMYLRRNEKKLLACQNTRLVKISCHLETTAFRVLTACLLANSAVKSSEHPRVTAKAHKTFITPSCKAANSASVYCVLQI